MSNDPPRHEPWLTIPASDYEGHMGAPDVWQLAALGDALAEALARLRPARLLVVGCATGNGLERVDPRVTRRVVGIDVNPAWLEVARRRFDGCCPGLQLVGADVERHEFEGGSFDLIFAGLILEYVKPERLLPRMADWLADGGGIGVVIQLPDDRIGMVSESPYESLRALAPAMRLLTAEELDRRAREAGFEVVGRREIPLPNGKRLYSAYLSRLRRSEARSRSS